MTFPTLYHLTSLGQTQTWRIETAGVRYRTVEGLLGGVLTTSAWTKCSPKNVGRANETTGREQAEREAAARHQRKIDSGYHEDQASIGKARFFEPMLAHTWTEDMDLTVIVASQPKLDGVRCIATKDGLFTRGGKPIVAAPHVWKAVQPLFAATPTLVLDGELYNHDLKDDFNRIVSLVKKTKPTVHDLINSLTEVQYWVYDLFDEAAPADSYMARLSRLRMLRIDQPVYRVPTALASERHTLDALYDQYLKDGYEGQMIRLNASYEHKRSRHLLKRKTFIDSEFELVDLEAGRGGAAHRAARAILKTDAGITFEVGIIGSHAYATQLLTDRAKLVGRRATVIYQNLTPAGVPRFAKLKAIRDYET